MENMRCAKKVRSEPLASSQPCVPVEHEDLDDRLSLETAQDYVDDWVSAFPLQQRKELAVALFLTYGRRQQMGVLDAAQEAASVTGFSDRTVRRYWKEWSENEGSFEESEQGKHPRLTLLSEDEECRSRALTWIRTNAIRQGESNLTARAFASFVNDELLPNICLAPGFPRSISVRTARRWLCSLGFEYMSTH